MSLGLGSASWASRADPQGLERRLAKLEQVVRQQDAAIKTLQARIDPMGGAASLPSWADAAGARDRSRTPPPAAMGFFSGAAAPARSVVDEFARANALDEKCWEALCSQPPAVQEYVIAQGPAEGRSPSAMIMGRIKKATAGESGGVAPASAPMMMTAQMEEFIAVTGVDEKCREALSNQPPAVQEYVIALGPAEGRNPSAMIMGRIAKATAGAGGGVAPGSASMIAAGVEEFIAAHAVDEKCAEALRNQTVQCQMAVLGAGPADGRNPAAMIMGRIAKYQRG